MKKEKDVKTMNNETVKPIEKDWGKRADFTLIELLIVIAIITISLNSFF